MGDLKRFQVDGERYKLPDDEVDVQRLIKKALNLDAKIRELQAEYEAIRAAITAEAEARRGDRGSVKLEGPAGVATITFRDKLEPRKGADLGELRRELGDSWPRFFETKTSWKISKPLKSFMEGKDSAGFSDPDAIRKRIGDFVETKTIKPTLSLKGGAE